METFKREQPENFDKTELPPIIKNIIEGKSEITFDSDGTESRKYAGDEWLGHYYLYKLTTIPHRGKEGEKWKTYLTTWDPCDRNQNGLYKNAPHMQITISTGFGEIPLSNDKDIIDRVYREISRQVSK